ncbi:MAG: hypothetical protein CML61_05630 [Rhodobacteraceae bacterium]|nr:hypothetical protein [Paracoccaceae bacterium]
MIDFLAMLYPWTKALHIIAVIAWMAGLFYLPRLMVHHTERVGLTGETHELFSMMEAKLSRVIMGPAMVVTWIFGISLVLTPGLVDWTLIWPWAKGAAVIAMSVFHVFLERRVKDFNQGRNDFTGRQYRILNEVPTLLLIIIVFSVVVKF